jgi:hypothetical protein
VRASALRRGSLSFLHIFSAYCTVFSLAPLMLLSEVSVGVITGFGMYGYQLALDAMLQHLDGA